MKPKTTLCAVLSSLALMSCDNTDERNVRNDAGIMVDTYYDSDGDNLFDLQTHIFYDEDSHFAWHDASLCIPNSQEIILSGRHYPSENWPILEVFVRPLAREYEVYVRYPETSWTPQRIPDEDLNRNFLWR